MRGPDKAQGGRTSRWIHRASFGCATRSLGRRHRRRESHGKRRVPHHGHGFKRDRKLSFKLPSWRGRGEEERPNYTATTCVT